VAKLNSCRFLTGCLTKQKAHGGSPVIGSQTVTMVRYLNDYMKHKQACTHMHNVGFPCFYGDITFTYCISPNFNPTPTSKPSHYRKLSAFLHFQLISLVLLISCFPHGTKQYPYKEKDFQILRGHFVWKGLPEKYFHLKTRVSGFLFYL